MLRVVSKLWVLICVVLCAISLSSISASAEDYSLRFVYERDGVYIDGAEVGVYKLNDEDVIDLMGVSTDEIDSFIEKVRPKYSDLSFSFITGNSDIKIDVNEGEYLICQIGSGGTADEFEAFRSCVVRVPYYDGGKLITEVGVYPKTERKESSDVSDTSTDLPTEQTSAEVSDSSVVVPVDRVDTSDSTLIFVWCTFAVLTVSVGVMVILGKRTVQ